MSDSDLELSIIIVTYNSIPAVVSCLDSLIPERDLIPFEVIVVDNVSSDGTVDRVIGHAIRPRVIVTDSNLGFAGGCNRGAGAAAGRYLLFLNPDVEVDRGALKALVGFADDRSGVGLLTGRLRHPNDQFQPNCRRLPTLRNLLFSRGSWLSRFVGDSGSYTMPDSSEPMAVEAVAGTMLLVSRVTFRELGGFDERFFMYMEDTDLSARALNAGYTNFFVPQAEAMHQWAKGSRAGRIRRLYLHHRSIWKYFAKHFPVLPTMIMLSPMLLINFVLAALFGTRQSGKS